MQQIQDKIDSRFDARVEQAKQPAAGTTSRAGSGNIPDIDGDAVAGAT